eukprot:scaffold83200_cov24-Prasinocladus_malaysianus.AAC.1
MGSIKRHNKHNIRSIWQHIPLKQRALKPFVSISRCLTYHGPNSERTERDSVYPSAALTAFDEVIAATNKCRRATGNTVMQA